MKKFVPLACALLLTACGESDVQQVRNWMTDVEKQTKPTVKPLPEPKTFTPFSYAAIDALDPFNASKLLTELAKSRPGGAQAPDQNRRKGFKDALSECGLDVDNRVAADFTVEGGSDAAEQLLQAAPQIDYLWNHDDDQGVGVLAAIDNAGRDEFTMW